MEKAGGKCQSKHIHEQLEDFLVSISTVVTRSRSALTTLMQWAPPRPFSAGGGTCESLLLSSQTAPMSIRTSEVLALSNRFSSGSPSAAFASASSSPGSEDFCSP